MPRVSIDTGFPGKPRFKLVWDYDDFSNTIEITDALNSKTFLRLSGFRPEPNQVDFVDMLCHMDDQYNKEHARANFNERRLDAALTALGVILDHETRSDATLTELGRIVGEALNGIADMAQSEQDLK